MRVLTCRQRLGRRLGLHSRDLSGRHPVRVPGPKSGGLHPRGRDPPLHAIHPLGQVGEGRAHAVQVTLGALEIPLADLETVHEVCHGVRELPQAVLRIVHVPAEPQQGVPHTERVALFQLGHEVEVLQLLDLLVNHLLHVVHVATHALAAATLSAGFPPPGLTLGFTLRTTRVFKLEGVVG